MKKLIACLTFSAFVLGGSAVFADTKKCSSEKADCSAKTECTKTAKKECSAQAKTECSTKKATACSSEAKAECGDKKGKRSTRTALVTPRATR